MNGAFGVLAALLERAATGRGKVVRTSLLASVVGVHAFQGTRATVAGETPHAQGNHHPSIAPYGLFTCNGGHVQISVGSEKLWQAFATLFGLDPAEPRFATNALRVVNRSELMASVEQAFAKYGPGELLQILDETGIPSGRVRNLSEVYAWEQLRSQHLLVDVEHPLLGTVQLPGSPLRFFDGDGMETTRKQHGSPPLLNQHGDSIKAWLSERAAS